MDLEQTSMQDLADESHAALDRLVVRMGQKTRLIDATTLETPFRRAYERTLARILHEASGGFL